ncbi:hypothetical protein [Methylomonas sp. AM2-LC]|uniref:hypothetical protein n=1 Tax=Methylomonas sp. AM2-LC TaxID=3153301 RepID=UPI0032636A8B
MHKIFRYLIWSFGSLSALLALALLLLILASVTPGGRAVIETSVLKLSAGKILLSGLSADFPDQVSIGQISMQDAEGVWLRIDDLLLDWQPAKLLVGELNITQLQARFISLERLPVAGQESSSSVTSSLPLTLVLNSLFIERFEMAASLAGDAANFQVSGRTALVSIKRAEVELRIQNLEKQGTYSLFASLIDETLDTHMTLQEASAGPLATLAGLSSQTGLNVNVSLAGPLAALQTHIALKLDSLTALLDGNINWIQNSVDLMLTANAPAMHVRSDLAWQTLALKLQLQGELSRLNVNGDCSLQKLMVGQVVIDKLISNLLGKDGQIKLNGELSGVRLATDEPDVLLAEPLLFEAHVATDQANFPVSLALKHSLIDVSGQTTMLTDNSSASLMLSLPRLQPLAALFGLQMTGSADMQLNYAQQNTNKQLALHGSLSLNSDDSVWVKLLGEVANFNLSMSAQDKDIALSSLHVDGKNLSLAAVGDVINGDADFNWQLHLNKLTDIIIDKSGQLTAQGQLHGSLHDLTVSSDLIAELANKAYASESLHAHLQLQHLPNRAEGQLTLVGEFLQAPLEIIATVNSPDLKSVNIVIDKADWKSLQAQGGLQFTENNAMPKGKIDIKVEHLSDFQALLKEPLSGRATASLETNIHNSQALAKFKLAAMHLNLPGRATITQTNLELNISDALGQPQVQGIVDVQGVTIGKLAGSAQLKLEGGLQDLNLQMSATMPDLSGSTAQLSLAAMLNKNNSGEFNWSLQHYLI